MMKHTIRTPQQKADLLNAFDSLPEGKTGARGSWMREHGFGWTMMNRWREDPEVAPLLHGAKQTAAPSASFDLPKIAEGRKRIFTLRQKASIISAYDAMPKGAIDRGVFLKRYHLHWGMLNRWRAELKREGTRIPKLKPIMNGAEPEPKPEARGGARPGAGRPPGKKDSLISKLSGEQILQLVRERFNTQRKAYESVILDLEDLLK